jgi:Right handed beta helix region
MTVGLPVQKVSLLVAIHTWENSSDLMLTFRRRVVNSAIQDNQIKQKLSGKFKSMSALCLFAASAFSLAPAFATKYYVDIKAGNDNNSGLAVVSAFRNIQKAANIVRPGDTVVVRDGIYNTSRTDAMVILDHGGVAGKPVTFIAEHPGGAWLSGNSNYTVEAWSFSSGVNYVNIQGFEMSRFSLAAIIVGPGSNNIGITGNHIHDIGRICTNSNVGRVGLYARGSSSITIANNIIHDIGRFAPGESGCKPSNANYQNHDHGIYLDGVKNVTLSSNTFYNTNRGWGVQVYSGDGNVSTGIKILNNSFSYPNPYRDGYIIFSNPGITQSSVSNNKFHQPRGKGLVIKPGITSSGISASNNITD